VNDAHAAGVKASTGPLPSFFVSRTRTVPGAVADSMQLPPWKAAGNDSRRPAADGRTNRLPGPSPAAVGLTGSRDGAVLRDYPVPPDVLSNCGNCPLIGDHANLRVHQLDQESSYGAAGAEVVGGS
jgi:hypothetical protein